MESGSKSMKKHLRKVTGEVKLTFKELSTVVAQIEACLNSRPLISLASDDEGLEVLISGHFLIGQALEAPSLTPLSPTTLMISSSYVAGNCVKLLYDTFGKDGLQNMSPL